MAEQEQHTPGPWVAGKTSDAIISKDPDALAAHRKVHGDDGVGYYGGALICESVSPRDRPIIKAAPEMQAAVRDISRLIADGQLVRDIRHDSVAQWEVKYAAAIAQARPRSPRHDQ